MKKTKRGCLMNTARIGGCLAIAVCTAALTVPPAHAGTKYQTSLVPLIAGSTPGFSAKGSSIKLDDKLRLKGKIKKVVDGAGVRVTTDGVPSPDDYSVEVDLAVAAGTAAGTVTVFFDLNNGNGKFAADLSTDPVISAAAAGDGIAVNAVRVKDASSTLFGVGGFAIPVP